MDDLNNSQVILLAILVSFVTSMATGITTVSLMQEAPVNVTQTITRVVERTVEKVIPGSTTVKEVSKVISVDDLVVEAVKKASPSVVTLYSTQSTSTQAGFFVSSSYVVTIDTGDHSDSAYVLKDKDGASIALKFVKSDAQSRLAVYTPLLPSGTKSSFPPLTFSKGEASLGQTSIALATDGSGDRVLSVGIITNVEGSTTTPQTIRSNAITSASVGGPLIDIHGELIGVSIQERTALGLYQLRQLLDSIK